MLKWIDTHAHYDHKRFNKDRKILLGKTLPGCIHAAITLGTNTKTNAANIALAERYGYLYAMTGFYPCDTWELEPDLCPDAAQNLERLKEQLRHEKVVGLGEIGIDYHWDSVGPREKEIKGERARQIQKRWFRKQLELAAEMNLPVSMHSREAEEDTLEIFSKFESVKGVMHCFSYGRRSAEKYLKKGLYLGVGGTLTYPGNEELREAIKNTPLNRILLETDAPYLSPQEVRNKRNDSSNIRFVVEELAKIYQTTPERVVEQTNENAAALFGIGIRD